MEGAPGEGSPDIDRGFLIDIFGRRWWMDTSSTSQEFHDTLVELWSAAAPTDAGADRADTRLRIRVTPPGSPEPQRRDEKDYPTSQPRDADDAAYAVSRSVTYAGIRERAGQALMLHAVGVTHDDGHLVALVGKSGTGKTTAARLLGQTMGYVTDETVIIEADHSISPYPKPLSVITDASDGTRKAEHSPASLGLKPRPPTATLGAIVVLVRDPEAPRPVLEPIGVAEAMLALLPDTSALVKVDRPLDTLARALVSHGGPYRLTYAEIEDCVELIAQVALPHDERDASAPPWTHYPGTRPVGMTDDEELDLIQGAAEPDPLDLHAHSLIARDLWDDAIESEGDVVLLRGSIPIHLAGVGSTTWLALHTPQTLQDLHDRIVSVIGEHPRSWALVHQAVSMLVHQRLATVVDPDEDQPSGRSPV